jgi:SAM-dependent methyltransferase
MPAARIKGIDINPHNIAVCRRKWPSSDGLLSFEVADSTRHEPDEAYDAAFCMAVFRDGRLAHPSRATCADVVRFADFEAAVADVARCLRPGGLFYIAHANFLFEDAAAAALFEPCEPGPRAGARPSRSPVFDRFDRRVAETNTGGVAFRKKRVGAAPG